MSIYWNFHKVASNINAIKYKNLNFWALNYQIIEEYSVLLSTNYENFRFIFLQVFDYSASKYTFFLFYN